MEVYLPIAEVNINAIEILLLSAIVGVLVWFVWKNEISKIKII